MKLGQNIPRASRNNGYFFGDRRERNVRAQFQLHCMETFIFSRRTKSNSTKMNKKRGKKTHTWQNEEKKKTKEQNINAFQSLLGGLIGLPERDRAWTSSPTNDGQSFIFLWTSGGVRTSLWISAARSSLLTGVLSEEFLSLCNWVRLYPTLSLGVL